MPQILDLFEIDGLCIYGQVNVVSGVDNPNTAGYDAPIGSMYLRTNGETWKKIGAGIYEWAREQSGGTGNTTNLLSIIVTDDYIVDSNVGTVSFNHYFEDGVTCTLDSPTYYTHDVTIKNLSGSPLVIKSLYCRIDGHKTYQLDKKFSAITVRPADGSWVIVGQVLGK